MVVRRCSTSRKITVAPATTIASPLASAIKGTSSGIADPERRPRLGPDDEVDRHDDGQHHEQRGQVCGDDRERQQLAREPDLLHEVRLPEQARRRHLDCRLEERPADEARDHEQRVVLDRHRLEQDREEQPVRDHEPDRVDERPGEAERRPAVANPELTAGQAAKELAVPKDVCVEAQGTRSLVLVLDLV